MIDNNCTVLVTKGYSGSCIVYIYGDDEPSVERTKNFLRYFGIWSDQLRLCKYSSGKSMWEIETPKECFDLFQSEIFVRALHRIGAHVTSGIIQKTEISTDMG